MHYISSSEIPTKVTTHLSSMYPTSSYPTGVTPSSMYIFNSLNNVNPSTPVPFPSTTITPVIDKDSGNGGDGGDGGNGDGGGGSNSVGVAVLGGIGGVIAVIVVLILIVTLLIIVLLRKNRTRQKNETAITDALPTSQTNKSRRYT